MVQYIALVLNEVVLLVLFYIYEKILTNVVRVGQNKILMRLKINFSFQPIYGAVTNTPA